MPVEAGGRHYRGPEQRASPTPPPQPAMPLAEELLGDVRGYVAEPFEPQRAVSPADAQAFAAWFQQRQDDDENPAGVAKLQSILQEAFHAGIAHVRDQMAASVRRPKQAQETLEGTVESRTIIAALQFFKDQILLANPDEVRSGEWLNARDVDVLIEGIRKRSTS